MIGGRSETAMNKRFADVGQADAHPRLHGLQRRCEQMVVGEGPGVRADSLPEDIRRRIQWLPIGVEVEIVA
jgi:hypothetical protein